MKKRVPLVRAAVLLASVMVTGMLPTAAVSASADGTANDDATQSLLLSYAPADEVSVEDAADLAVAYLSLSAKDQRAVLTHYGQSPDSQTLIRTDTASGAEPQRVRRAVPIIAVAALVGCLGSVGLSTYQAFKGGDPVEFIAGAVIGCVPLGPVAPALKPAVVAAINAAKPAVITGLKAFGLAANSTLIPALEGDS